MQVERPLDEARLADLDYVAWWERTARSPAGVGYLLELTVPGLPRSVPPHHELGVANWEMTLADGGLDISLVGEQDAVARLVRAYDEVGLRPTLRALSDYQGPDDVLRHLTERQREVVRTAYRLGYYEVPRRASTAAVADELGLDPSTVAEHLQRAERNLLSALLGP